MFMKHVHVTLCLKTIRKNEVECTCMIEIRKVKLLAVGNTCKAIFWPTSGLKMGNFKGSGFSKQRTLILTSAVACYREAIVREDPMSTIKNKMKWKKLSYSLGTDKGKPLRHPSVQQEDRTQILAVRLTSVDQTLCLSHLQKLKVSWERERLNNNY